MEIALLIATGLLVVAFNFFRLGDYFSPWMITTGIWFGILLLFQFQGDILEPLSSQFTTCLTIWLPIFCVSSLLTYYCLPKIQDEDKACISEQPINDILFNFFFVITLIVTPLYLYKILRIVMMFDTTDMLYNLRLLAVYGDNTYGFLNYSHILNQVLFVIAVWRYPKVPLWQLILIVATTLMSQFAIMEKSGVLFLFTTSLFVMFEKRVIRLRTILLTVGVIVVIFFLINFSKEIKSDETAESMTFIDFFAIYILSPAVAFGRVKADLSMQFGSHTFQYVYLFLDRWGIGNFIVNDRLQEFVWVPLPTNVYTIFQPFCQDFGYAGVAFFAFVYGTVSGFVYQSFRSGSFVGRCVYAFIIKVLVTQFFSESLVQDLVMFIQFVFFVFIISLANIVIRPPTPRTSPTPSQK